MAKLKPFLRWVIFGGIAFFFLKILRDYWDDVTAITINTTGWLLLATALFVTLGAHFWSAYVWYWMLKLFQQPVKAKWAIQVYLMTNMAKYLPGNVWHFYGRIQAVTKTGSDIGAATISVLLEPLLMAAAASIFALVSACLGWLKTSGNWWLFSLQFLGLGIVLIAINPVFLNPVIGLLNRLKAKSQEKIILTQYPILPLMGELGFIALRATGFLLAVMAFFPVTLEQIPNLISVFSLAWLLGLIIPGAPGGLGVFEATAIAFLDKNYFSPGIVLTMVALFRLVSIIAEAIAASLAYFSGGRLNL